jgi:hypothetical protein
MGSYADLRIGEVESGRWRDWINDVVMILFTEEEKRVETRPLPSEYEHLLEGETSPLLSVKYVSNVETLKKRLDFLGFTFETARRAFDLGRTWEIKEIRSSIGRLQQQPFALAGRDMFKERTDRGLKRIEMLARSDADCWLMALREAFLAPADTGPTQLSELAASFRTVAPVFEMRFPYTTDDRFRLRFELEAHQSGEVVLDATDLIDGGCCSASDLLAECARESVPSRDRQALHLIVLTEGSTDKFVLEAALRVLRPELRQYISFMDFAALRVEGGASFLASIVRAFAGAGVRDRLVAVFDNDTAGCLSQSLL